MCSFHVCGCIHVLCRADSFCNDVSWAVAMCADVCWAVLIPSVLMCLGLWQCVLDCGVAGGGAVSDPRESGASGDDGETAGAYSVAHSEESGVSAAVPGSRVMIAVQYCNSTVRCCVPLALQCVGSAPRSPFSVFPPFSLPPPPCASLNTLWFSQPAPNVCAPCVLLVWSAAGERKSTSGRGGS